MAEQSHNANTQDLELEAVVGGYPGRGLLLHTSSDARQTWMYFITGRSESSRSRRIRVDPHALLVEPTGSEAERDRLRHDTCARRTEDGLVIGNGDHVDVIADRLISGLATVEAVVDIVPEPDPPIFTPRIAMIVGTTAEMFSVFHEGDTVRRRLDTVPMRPNSATVLSTYSGMSDEPRASAPTSIFEEVRDRETVIEALWSALDHQLRVALAWGPVEFEQGPALGAVRNRW